MYKEEGWVELCATNTDYEAHLISGLLESNGIHVQIRSFRVSQFPFDIGHIGEIKVMVPEADLEEAKKILKNVDNDSMESPDGRKQLDS